MDIKPIETVYNGYRFRSRLEARWAVFFDAIGTTWEYEPEGFALPDGTYYLPDFYLPESKWWVEVKGVMTDTDLHKIELFRNTDRKLIILGSIPSGTDAENMFDMVYYNAPDVYGIDGIFGTGFDYPYLPCICPVCGKFGFEFDGRGWRVCCHDGEDGKHYSYDHPRIIEAFRQARQARFEHGETPQIRR